MSRLSEGPEFNNDDTLGRGLRLSRSCEGRDVSRLVVMEYYDVVINTITSYSIPSAIGFNSH